MKYCLIIPHYNHHRQFAEFLPKLASLGFGCIVVDDGSTEESRKQAEATASQFDNVHFFAHRHNRGKGSAVVTGVCHAQNLGYTHGIQIDADGQHNVEDVNKFIELSQAQPDKIICGRPTFDESVPKIRLYGRKITDFWVVLETWSLAIKDGLCGFRVYPLDKFDLIYDHYYVGSRMDFDTEILVKALWHGLELSFMETRVRYPEEGVSHFNYLRDNLLLIRLHLRLLFGMIPRIPVLLYRAIK